MKKLTPNRMSSKVTVKIGEDCACGYACIEWAAMLELSRGNFSNNKLLKYFASEIFVDACQLLKPGWLLQNYSQFVGGGRRYFLIILSVHKIA